LKDPHKNQKFIHVAGTNGKSSACYELQQRLMRRGLKVGLFISPHILTFRERIRVDN